MAVHATSVHVELIPPMRQAVIDSAEAGCRLEIDGSVVGRLDSDELPHARPATAGRALLDQPFAGAFQAERAALDQRRNSRFPRRRNPILQTGLKCLTAGL